MYEAKAFISNNFDMKDLHEADMILNTRLLRNENSIILSQSHYAENMLKNLFIMNVNLFVFHIDPSVN